MLSRTVLPPPLLSYRCPCRCCRTPGCGDDGTARAGTGHADTVAEEVAAARVHPDFVALDRPAGGTGRAVYPCTVGETDEVFTDGAASAPFRYMLTPWLFPGFEKAVAGAPTMVFSMSVPDKLSAIWILAWPAEAGLVPKP